MSELIEHFGKIFLNSCVLILHSWRTEVWLRSCKGT